MTHGCNRSVGSSLVRFGHLVAVILWCTAPGRHNWLGRAVSVLVASAWFAWRIRRWWRRTLIDNADDRLELWCARLGIRTPEVLDWRETELGERFELRVTPSTDDLGELFTVARFKALELPLRDVIGDECRRVDIHASERHGGRCDLDIQWRDKVTAPRPPIVEPTFVTTPAPRPATAEPVAAGPNRFELRGRVDKDSGLVFYDVVPTAHAADESEPREPLSAEPTSAPLDPPTSIPAPPILPTDPNGGAGFDPPAGTTPVTLLRPLNARPGTRTGALWDALTAPGGHPRAALVDASGVTAGTASNTLRDWQRLGLATTVGGLWYATCASLPDDEQADAV